MAPYKKISKNALALLPALLLAACGGSSGDTEPTSTNGNGNEVVLVPDRSLGQIARLSELNPSDCSIEAQTQWVDFNMRDYYLYYDQVPALDLVRFISEDELIRALRVDPPDKFSNVQDASTQATFFDEGVSFGYGLTTRRDADNNLVIAQPFLDSPAQLAGFNRGDIIVQINGIDFDLQTSEQIEVVFQRNVDTPATSTFTLLDPTGIERDVTVTQAQYPANGVQFRGTRLLNGVLVGYLNFSTFVEPANAQLDEAMQFFSDQGISELIVDLRYNGGGRTSVAHKLAAQIAGSAFFGQPLQILRRNDKYTRSNATINFPSQDNFLGLQRVIFLTTNSTASSSEIVINGLRPYLDVVLVGETTSAKPFQSSARDRCEISMNAMEVISENSAGQSVIEGVPPTCEVEDDYQFPLGNSNEALLSAAEFYLINNSCPAPAVNANAGANADANTGTKASVNAASETARSADLPTMLNIDNPLHVPMAIMD